MAARSRATATEALFQQTYGRVVQAFTYGALLYWRRVLPNGCVELIDKPLKSGQSGRNGNSGATEEHYTPIFVGLDKAVRDVRAVFYKLHVIDAASLVSYSRTPIGATELLRFCLLPSVRAPVKAVWSYRLPALAP